MFNCDQACSAAVIALRFGTQGPGFKPCLFHKACYMPLQGCSMKLRVFFWLTAICVKWENGKSISSIETGQASIEHGAKTDSDLARPPGVDDPATQQASPGVPTRSTAQRAAGNRRRGTRTQVPVTRGGAKDVDSGKQGGHSVIA
jgi:hypothetical protein